MLYPPPLKQKIQTIFHRKVTCVYVGAGGGVSTDLHLVPFTSRYLIHEPIFLTHFLTCTFISMSTSISKGCHGHVCWGKPDTTGYGNRSTDLPGTYYSSDAPLHCPLSNILTPSTLHPSYNVHVLGHTWFNLFLFVLCTL